MEIWERTTITPERLRLLGQFAAVAVESGRGVFFSPATGRIDLIPGDVILLFPEEPTTYGGTGGYQTCWVVWNGPEAATLATHTGFSPRQPLVRGAASAVRHAVASLMPLMQAESFAAVLERKRLLLGLMAELLQRRAAGAGPQDQADRISALLARLSEPGIDAQPVSALAKECHLSVAQFRRLFRRHTGRSPVEFLTARRMAQAKELLMQGLPMKDVALQTGFADVFYFMRVFRTTTGQTAGAFLSQNAPERQLP